MKALFLKHDHLSPSGALSRRMAEQGFEVHESVVVPESRYHRPSVAYRFPAIDDYDVVVVMGAPWGAYDDQAIGMWLADELDWLRALHSSDVAVLGVCFGGQALARALGGSVAPAPVPEIGLSVIHSDDPELVGEGPWFQFHYDRWQIPPNAREIARNPYASQAFVSARTLAVQFHPELDSTALDVWAQDGVLADQVRSAGQDFEVMRRQVAASDVASRERASRLIDSFLARVDALGASERRATG